MPTAAPCPIALDWHRIGCMARESRAALARLRTLLRLVLDDWQVRSLDRASHEVAVALVATFAQADRPADLHRESPEDDPGSYVGLEAYAYEGPAPAKGATKPRSLKGDEWELVSEEIRKTRPRLRTLAEAMAPIRSTIADRWRLADAHLGDLCSTLATLPGSETLFDGSLLIPRPVRSNKRKRSLELTEPR